KIKDMKKKAIFLDRDGTINIDTGYVSKWKDFVFIEGVINTLKKLKDAGYLIIILTTQSGVARGFFSEKEVQDLHSAIDSFLLATEGFQFDAIYYCPHYPNTSIKEYSIVCQCRKPQKGMLLQALNDFDIDLNASFMIGDKDSDNIAPAELAFIKVSKDYTLVDVAKEIILKDLL
ncbi:MAG: D-glycero-alpha-D-manno-heptose-1,7-bisphosphate 7-phosphatase, partial [Treponemataceae bacterium]